MACASKEPVGNECTTSRLRSILRTNAHGAASPLLAILSRGTCCNVRCNSFHLAWAANTRTTSQATTRGYFTSQREQADGTLWAAWAAPPTDGACGEEESGNARSE